MVSIVGMLQDEERYVVLLQRPACFSHRRGSVGSCSRVSIIHGLEYSAIFNPQRNINEFGCFILSTAFLMELYGFDNCMHMLISTTSFKRLFYPCPKQIFDPYKVGWWLIIVA